MLAPTRWREKKNEWPIIPASFYSEENIAAIPPIKEAKQEVHEPQPALQKTFAQLAQQEPRKEVDVPTKTSNPSLRLGVNLKKPGLDLNKKEELCNETGSTLQNLAKDKFDIDQLLKVWADYAEIVRQQKKESFYITLTMNTPVLENDFRVTFPIGNSVQKLEFDREQDSLVAHLRTALNNFSITLQIELQKTDDKVNLYIDSEKLKAMIEKHPNLADFVKKFDLNTTF